MTDLNPFHLAIPVRDLKETLAFYEKVLVLERGAVVEYDAPGALLRKPGGVFKALAEESGDLDGLRRAADDAEREAS